jgi:hypothetical protein
MNLGEGTIMPESFFSTTIRAQRFLLWLSSVAANVFFISWGWMMGFFPPPSPSLPVDAVIKLYTDNLVQFRVAAALAILSGGYMIPWSLVVSMQMARLEKGAPIWAILQFICASINSIFIWGPALIWGIAAFSVERDPALTVLLHEAGWLTLICALSVFALNLLTVIVVCFSKNEDDKVSAFPRWLGYLTIWQAVQSYGGPMALLFKKGIFAWNGLIPFWLPTALFGAWFLALTITMLRALRHQERAARA